MSEIMTSVTLAGQYFHDPVVYMPFQGDNEAWIFTDHSFTPNTWLLLHRQSLSDGSLDNHLIDQLNFGAPDRTERLLKQLYHYFNLNPDRVGDVMFYDDAPPIRAAIQMGDLKVFKYHPKRLVGFG